jgi:phage I-like protein
MRIATALLAASLPLLANGRAQLLPAGEFAARDGRPGNGLKWKVSDERGQALVTAMNAVIGATPIVIDYEHQTLHKERNGQPAPAAGWIRRAEWLSGKGLEADVEWTDKAAAAIKAGEYRYISPVITWDRESGEVTGVHLAALTNHPALLGMDAAAALSTLNDPDTEEQPMKLLLTALATFLGVSALDTEQAAIDALKAFKPKATLPDALSTALGLAAGADEAAALTAIATLKTPATETVALVASLQSQVAALTAKLDADKVQAAVDEAITAGKLAPAQRDQYVQLGTKDMAMLTAILAAAPVIPGLAGQSAAAKAAAAGAENKGGAVAALTADQTAIAAQLGIAPADFLKQLQAA